MNPRRWRRLTTALLGFGLFALAAHGERIQDPNNPAVSYEMDPEILAVDAGAPGATIVTSQTADGEVVEYLCDDQTYQFNTFGGTDVWGYTDPQGREYALMGTFDGITVVNVTDDQTVGTIPYTTGCGWRDIKTYSTYAYATSECGGINGGILVIDLANLPNSISAVTSVAVDGGTASASHNLSIDTVNGYLYAEGYSVVGLSIHIHSLANPAAPAYVASFGPSEVHDIYCHDDTCYVAAGNTHTWQIWNTANKFSPTMITQVSIPASGYVHNIWPSDDRNYCVTTEETFGKTVKIWDIQDLGNVQLVGQFLGPNGLAHNAHWQGNEIFVSHYESGIVIADVTDPTNPTIRYQFDTWGNEAASFDGCWGVFPHTAGGKIYASNRDGHLYVLSENQTTLNDSLYGLATPAQPGEDVRYDVYAHNSFNASIFVVPINWNGTYLLTLDSVTTTGTRTDGWGVALVASNTPAKQRVYRVSSVSSSLEPGDGPIMSVWFSVPPVVFGDSNPIAFTPLGQNNAAIGGNCLQTVPDTVSGAIVVGGCCAGMTGDMNGDLTDAGPVDLSYLVDYLFSNGPAPVCPEEADVNGDSQPADPVDLSYLVGFMFTSGPAPVGCP